MLEKLKGVSTDLWIVSALMVALILFGMYMSYRPHKVAAEAPSAPVVAKVYS